MARNALVDAGFVVALLSSRDDHHEWAVTQASEFLPPWSPAKLFYPSPSTFLVGVAQPISAHWFVGVLCWLALNLPKTLSPL
jgi:hypothetical protein